MSDSQARGAAAVEAGAFEPRRHDIFFAAVETTRMPMIVTDPHRPDNPIVFANRAFLQMTGYGREEIEGTNCRFLQGPETDRGTIEEVRRGIAERREVAVEVLNYRKDGSSFWNALFVSPVYDRAGELIYFFGSQLDISRRRDAEESLRQAQKMEAIGQLTGGIAHDFNNLLQVVLGYVDSLRHQLGAQPGPRVTRSLDNIGIAAQRAAALTQQLLAFARKQRLDGRATNLNSLVKTLAELARRTLGNGIDIRIAADPELWNCRLDPVQAELAILNILINARDAMPEGGSVTLRTGNREVGAEDAARYGQLRPGRYAMLAITDTGHGIPPEHLKRVMEPFFTTKETGRGTGLGLAMVHGLARQSGGDVKIHSEVGHGTTVQLYFPAVAEAEGPPLPGAPAPIHAAGGGEYVLVVEDRADVAELARSILEDFGYRVQVARDAAEALEKLDGPARIDLLFSDLMMPGGMNGVALAREAKRRRPPIRVLLTTGYADALLEPEGAAEFEVISKPYRRSELARRVRLVLDGPPGVT